ncbi:MAG: universal stress protein [Dehalococcoidia bacterium]|nr:universal stress protein [Dehalococcoidia bacterium]
MIKVLVATDGSSYALHAADFVAKLCAQIQDSEVTIIYVIDPGVVSAAAVTPTGVPIPSAVMLPQELEKAAALALEATKQHLASSAKTLNTRVERGKPAEVIVKVAQDGKFDMIAVGSSGMGHIAGLLLGSVSDRVMHHAKGPVLIVRPAPEGK